MKEARYRDLVSRLDDRALQKRLPTRAMIELTHRCNFGCIHCYLRPQERQAQRPPELSSRAVCSLLRQFREMGGFIVGFTGGEIFLRPDLLEIVAGARREGLSVSLLTNGSLITEKLARALRKVGLNKLELTVHATDPSAFEEITRRQGSARRVFETLRILRKHRLPVCVKTFLMGSNRDSVFSVYEFCRTRKIPFRIDGELFPRKNKDRAPQALSESAGLLQRLRQSCYEDLYVRDEPERCKPFDPRGSSARRTRIFSCAGGYNSFAVDPSGKLKVCLLIDKPGYDLAAGSLRQGWEALKAYVDGCRPPARWACNRCALRAYCNWCPAHSYLTDGSLHRCNAYLKTRARSLKEYGEALHAP